MDEAELRRLRLDRQEEAATDEASESLPDGEDMGSHGLSRAGVAGFTGSTSPHL